jgi:hypothetical protein
VKTGHFAFSASGAARLASGSLTPTMATSVIANTGSE